jgi:hypothetical protein
VTITDVRCGRIEGVNRHNRLREPLCDRCREFKELQRASAIAAKRLAAEYPERFAELVAEARAPEADAKGAA